MCRYFGIHLLLLVLLTPAAFADVVVIVRREAETTGRYIRISDIARVEGPQEQVEEVAKIILGRTPPKGQRQEFTRWDIEHRLFELGVRARVTFSGNELVTVFGGGGGMAQSGADVLEFQPLAPIALEPSSKDQGKMRQPESSFPDFGWNATAPARPFRDAPTRHEAKSNATAVMNALSSEAKDRIANSISEFLAKQYSREDIEIRSNILSLDAVVPADAHEIKVVEAVGGHVPGKAMLRLAIRDAADAEPRTVAVSADTLVYGLALVATRQLNRADTLQPRDVAVKLVRMESGKAYFPPNPKNLAGLEMKRNVKAGEPLTTEDAVPGEAVKRGDLVVVDTVGQGWQIQGVAKAMGSGMVGDVIQVEDTRSKTKYAARITAHGVVSAMIQRDKLNNKW